MPKISPLYITNLTNKIETKLWEIFPEKKYGNVEKYMKRWYIDSDYNFQIYYKEDSGNIDLFKTLSDISDEELLMQIAIDLGIETPDTIPAVVEIKEILAKDYNDVSNTFQKAHKNIYEEPGIAIVCANSALEAIIKKICQDEKMKSCNNKDTLYKLTSHLLKEFNYFPDSKLNKNINTIGSSLLGICQAIEAIRSENTEGHGKTEEDYLIKDSIYSAFILNAVTTVGLFLLNYYEKQYKQEEIEDDLISEDEIPF